MMIYIDNFFDSNLRESSIGGREHHQLLSLQVYSPDTDIVDCVALYFSLRYFP